jgi:hypothetical protein
MWRPRRLEFRLEPTEIELLHRAGPDEWQPVPYDPASSSAPLPPPGAASVDALSIRPPHGPRTYMPVPGGHLRYYDFSELAIARGGKPAVRLVDEQANDLLAYLDRGWLDDALLLSEDFAGYAEIMLLRKRKDPVAAAAGAFALLRLGALDRLHDWTANLLEWFAWLPDGLVARAEHVARLGDHDAASALLRQLPERGVPVLSVGLATAVDRLRAYAAAWPEDEALRTASEWSTRYAVATDFSLPITTYFGRGPDAPEPPSGAAELARS